MSNSVSSEEGCFNFILKKGHSTHYAKDYLYHTKLAAFGNMTAANCVKSLVSKRVVKDEEEGWKAVRGALQKIFR